ncbi:MAG: hypothetical protein ACOCT7_02670 [Candidatus Saliniplasma sp.]
MKELYERYVKIYESSEDIKSDLKEEFTRDEMQEIFEDLDFEFKGSQNKDQISERMADEKFYEAVKEKSGEGEITIKVKKGEEDTKEKLISTLNILQDLLQDESVTIKKFWKNLKKEADKGLEDVKSTSRKHWDKIDEKWDLKSDRFQKHLDELEKSDIPDEELEELEERWGKITTQLDKRITDIREEMKGKKEDVKEIIYEYIGESQAIIEDDEKDMGDLYPLWFDMVKDIRDELEVSRDALEEKEIELIKTWDKLSTDLRKELKKLAREHEEEMEELFKIWISISEDVDKLLEQLPDKYYDIYGELWKGLRKKRPEIKFRLKELSEEYSELIKDPMKSIKTTYKKFTKTSKDEEIQELKKRIAKLEEKLDEED